MSAGAGFEASSGTPPSELVALSRMLRPFPVKKLRDVLYHVLATAHVLEQELHALEADPPLRAELWCFELNHFDEQLWSLTEYAIDAQAGLRRIYDTADADERRAIKAMTAILRGWGEEPPPEEPAPFREPQPCPACGGHGGTASDGDCDVCQGTGIDPDDPASPL